MSVRIILFYLLMIVPVLAQGFAGLGTDAEGFAVPQRGTVLQFPADHGPHPAFRIEWWYLTANLKGEDGQDYGIQWTLFRSALAPEEKPGWEDPQIWMAHAALTTAAKHYAVEKFARGGVGQAGVVPTPFSAWIDNWQMTSVAGDDADPLSTLDLSAGTADFTYALRLDANGPLVLHGDEGYSVKSEQGQASYYYSQPFYTVRGTLKIDGKTVAVTGRAWLDREWSSQPLSAGQTGWDWFSLHLDGGEKLMAFRLRDQGEGFTSATWIGKDGTPEAQPPGVLKLSPLDTADVAGRKIPVRWRVELPSKGLDITTRPLNPQSWMGLSFSYWEGPIFFEGSHSGDGYLEMTGYE